MLIISREFTPVLPSFSELSKHFDLCGPVPPIRIATERVHRSKVGEHWPGCIAALSSTSSSTSSSTTTIYVCIVYMYTSIYSTIYMPGPLCTYPCTVITQLHSMFPVSEGRHPTTVFRNKRKK